MVLLTATRAGRTLERVKKFVGRPLDLLFIDGDRFLVGGCAISRSTETWWPTGPVAFHDIVEDSFTRTGVRTKQWAGDVPRFWRMLKGAYEAHELVVSPDQDGLGIGVIRYDRSVKPNLT